MQINYARWLLPRLLAWAARRRASKATAKATRPAGDFLSNLAADLAGTAARHGAGWAARQLPEKTARRLLWQLLRQAWRDTLKTSRKG